MRQFSIGIIKEWNKTIEWLTQQTSVNKIIIDLRNNPGGSLQDVVDMLSSIVPKGLPIVHIGYHSYEEPINSAGLISYPRDTKKIIILTNR
jgi:C-terminal processing protease CtpA/Prc